MIHVFHSVRMPLRARAARRDPARERIVRLQEGMARERIRAALLFYSRDLLYYAGTTQPSCLVVTPQDYRLLIRAGRDFVVEETWLEEGRLGAWGGYQDAKGILDQWAIQGGRLGLEMDVIPAEMYLGICQAVASFEAVDISSMILKQRAVKDAWEVKRIREACGILHKGHERALEVFREGMTELELSAQIEAAHRGHGHEGEYFLRQFDFFMGRGPVVSGENLSRISGRVRSLSGVGLSPSVPAGASRRSIRKGDLLVVDIPTLHQGYHADQSRTYSVGRASQWSREAHDALREIADHVAERMRAGMGCAEMYRIAMGQASELGVAGDLMRLGRERTRVEFIGHGVGLEVNEPPLLGPKGENTLEEGMVLALELVMTRSETEVVKLEDMLLVTSRGAEFLTITPRELFEL